MADALLRQTDPYATHQRFLRKYIEHTSGDIIEFGIGHGSTPLILELIKDTNRKLVSVENNLEWLKKMQSLYPANVNHEYIFLDDWEKDISTIAPGCMFSICFVDSAPWESRIIAMKAFEHRAEYVLVHDVDYYPVYGFFGTVQGPHSFDFSDISDKYIVYFPDHPWPSETGPPTLVYTKRDDINLLD